MTAPIVPAYGRQTTGRQLEADASSWHSHLHISNGIVSGVEAESLLVSLTKKNCSSTEWAATNRTKCKALKRSY